MIEFDFTRNRMQNQRIKIHFNFTSNKLFLLCRIEHETYLYGWIIEICSVCLNLYTV
jgi:hypothetical protein